MKTRFLGKQVKKMSPPAHIDKIDSVEKMGEMIKYKRTNLGLSLKKTALLCGISDKSLRQLENGGNVKIETLFKVINILGLKVTIDE